MSACTVYYNPRCSKCGVTPRLVDYQQSPPEAAELTQLAELLGDQAAHLLRRDEAAAAGVTLPAELSIPELVQVVRANPHWMQRPVVVLDGRALIARPPERVLDLF
jgi:arsenate reductase